MSTERNYCKYRCCYFKNYDLDSSPVPAESSCTEEESMNCKIYKNLEKVLNG